MIQKADFRTLRPIARDVKSGVFTDARNPDFQFGISLRPMVAFSSLTALNQLCEELTEKYVTGKYDPESDALEVAVAATVTGEVIECNEDMLRGVATLLAMQSDKDDKGEKSPIYDEYELLCVQHSAPNAFAAAINFATEVNNAHEKKDEKPPIKKKMVAADADPSLSEKPSTAPD